MRGHVGKREGARGVSWHYVVNLGPDPVTGKPRQIWKRGFQRERDAADALALVLAERVETGGVIRPAKGTVAEYLNDWLERKKATVRPATASTYRKRVAYITAGLGSVKLSELDAATVETFYLDLLRSGGRDGKPLSAKTVQCVGGVLHKALRDAVRLRKIRSNPATDAELPKLTGSTATSWTATEAATFLASLDGERLAPMWGLVLATGLRRGELLGLRWQDVDLNAGRLQVVEQRIVVDGQVLVGEPKTDAGKRSMRLDAATVATLRAWRKTTLAERLAAGEAYEGSERVFVDELGREPHPETVTGWWAAAVKKAGVRHVRLHDGRHTAATLMLRAGVHPGVVQKRLGHTKVATTLGIYGHVDESDDQAAADALGGLLRGVQ